MIAIGGWNEGAKSYSQMVADDANRATFVDSVMAFLEEHEFDGLDLDWEYPADWTRGGQAQDKDNFVKLVDELSEKFKPKGYLLSAAVSAAESKIRAGYDVPRLAAKFDFINVMTYDLRGFWDRRTGHHSPLSRAIGEDPWSETAKLNSVNQFTIL